MAPNDHQDPPDSVPIGKRAFHERERQLLGGKHIWGSPGNNRLEGGPGDDRIYAGRGDDTVLFTWNSGHDIFFGESGFNTLHLYGPGMSRARFTLEAPAGSVTENAEDIRLTPGVVAKVTLDDGSSIELHEVQRITWGIER